MVGDAAGRDSEAPAEAGGAGSADRPGGGAGGVREELMTPLSDHDRAWSMRCAGLSTMVAVKGERPQVRVWRADHGRGWGAGGPRRGGGAQARRWARRRPERSARQTPNRRYAGTITARPHHAINSASRAPQTLLYNLPF